MSIDAIRKTLKAEKDNEFAFRGADHYALIELLAAHDALKAENAWLKANRDGYAKGRDEIQRLYYIERARAETAEAEVERLKAEVEMALEQRNVTITEMGRSDNRAETAEAEVERLTDELAKAEAEINVKADFIDKTVNDSAGQHDEIKRLRESINETRRDLIILGGKVKQAKKNPLGFDGMNARIASWIKRLDVALYKEICPRPCNSRPDDFSQQDCIATGECGCGKGNTNGN